MKSQKLHWITNHFAPYHDYLFRHLVSSSCLHLIVYYRHANVSSHPWEAKNQSPYQHHVLNEKLFGFDLKMIWRTLTSQDPFVIAGWNNLTYVLMITILAIRNRPFAIFTDTPKRKTLTVKQWLKNKWLKFVYRKKSRARLLVTGKIGMKVAQEIWGIQNHQMYNFPTATDSKLFAPANESPSMDEGVLRFANVGRLLLSHKGQDIALKALNKALGNQANYELLIVGTGPDEEQIRSLVRELDIDRQVHFLGWKQIEDLPGIFNSSHFTIHSSHEDPYPNAVMESLSCGTPVIGSDKAGSTERVIPGINGYIHEAGNVDDLAEKISSAVKLTQEEYKQMRIKSRETALQWTVDYNIRIIEELFCGK